MTAESTEVFVNQNEELIGKRSTKEAMEIDEKYANTVSVETSDHVNNIDQKENKNETTTKRLPRKEFRKFMKKQRKKNARIEAAKAKQERKEEGEKETPEAVIEAIEAEEKKRNAEKILWEVRERQINQANAEKKKKQEENERMKKIIQENWEKTIKNIKVPKSITEAIINNKNPMNQQNESIILATSPSVTSVQEDSSEKTDYGTEKDQINCPFYLKTGACRYGDSCGRHHHYPEKSVTILVKNMYEGMPVQLADEDNDDNLEYDEVEAERHYFEFFEDVHTEFQQYGTIVQFKVCNNFQLHLRGNVYVQYSNEDEAKRAIENIRGRWYAGKQLICDYCPVTKWKPAICGYYQRNQCPKGIQCNFLHVYKNPGGLYSDADRDFEDKRSADFIMTIENSSIAASTVTNKSLLESIPVSSTQSSKRSQSSNSDKSNSHHSTIEQNNKNSRRKNRSKSRSRSHSPPLQSNGKYHHSGYRHNHKRDNRYHSSGRDEHHHYHRGRHHKKSDRDLNESRSHHRNHWDRKPDYYMNIDDKKRKRDKRDENEDDDRKIHRRNSKRDPRKNSKNSKTNKNDNQSSDDSIVS